MLNVVMLVRDRLTLTKQSIESLVKNTTSQFALTVVDDASQLETADWLRMWVRVLPVGTNMIGTLLVRNEQSTGTGAARNQGIAEARKAFGDDNLLYLSDNDIFAQPKWDEAVIAAHNVYKGIKIIGGGCHPFMQPNIHNGDLKNRNAPEVVTRDAISGYSWLLSWETWDRFGVLQNTGLGVRQSEDWEYCQRITKAGYFVGSVLPEVVLHTGVFDTFGKRPPGWELLEQAKIEGVVYE